MGHFYITVLTVLVIVLNLKDFNLFLFVHYKKIVLDMETNKTQIKQINIKNWVGLNFKYGKCGIQIDVEKS